MGKIIIYFIFSLIGAFFFFGPAVGLYFVSQDTIAAISYEGRETGVVGACRSKRGRPNSGAYIKSPVVNRDSGGVVYSTVDEVRFLLPCNALIGKAVSIRYDTAKPSNARINTFHEMWFQPMMIGLVCLILYGAIAWAIIRRKS